MALANKCDRCGKLYERSTSSDKYSIRKILPYNVTKDVDLCAECSAQLMEFMKNPEVILVSDILL